MKPRIATYVFLLFINTLYRFVATGVDAGVCGAADTCQQSPGDVLMQLPQPLVQTAPLKAHVAEAADGTAESGAAETPAPTPGPGLALSEFGEVSAGHESKGSTASQNALSTSGSSHQPSAATPVYASSSVPQVQYGPPVATATGYGLLREPQNPYVSPTATAPMYPPVGGTPPASSSTEAGSPSYSQPGIAPAISSAAPPAYAGPPLAWPASGIAPSLNIGQRRSSKDCIGQYTAWSGCSANCVRFREFHIIHRAHFGGIACVHPDNYTERASCVGGQCPHHELAPAGSRPGDEKAETITHFQASGVALPFFIAIISSLLLAQLINNSKLLHFIPGSLVVVIISGIIGLIIRFTMQEHDRWGSEDFSPVSSSVMSLVLLPIIIFQAGWSISHKYLWNNFTYILILAVIGTTISTFAIAGLILVTGDVGMHVVTGVREAFTLAALISATDPVATLATFAAKQVEPKLNILVSGEAMLNDAVAITFFKLLNTDEPTEFFSWQTTALNALRMFIGSLVVGFGSGILLTSIYKGFLKLNPKSPSDLEGDHEHTSMEMLFIFSCAYLTNAIAESMHLSGIIACLFCGVLMGTYAKQLLTQHGRNMTDHYLHVCAHLADQTVFVGVGITTALLQSGRGMRFGVILFFMCLFGRALGTLGCGALCNAVHSIAGHSQEKPFDFKRLYMVWHAGLRGGIALMLVLELNDWAQHKAVLVTATFVVIVLFLLVMGGTTDLALERLEIQTGVSEDQEAWAHEEPKGFLMKLLNMAHVGLHGTLVGESASHRWTEQDCFATRSQ